MKYEYRVPIKSFNNGKVRIYTSNKPVVKRYFIHANNVEQAKKRIRKTHGTFWFIGEVKE